MLVHCSSLRTIINDPIVSSKRKKSVLADNKFSPLYRTKWGSCTGIHVKTKQNAPEKSRKVARSLLLMGLRTKCFTMNEQCPVELVGTSKQL